MCECARARIRSTKRTSHHSCRRQQWSEHNGRAKKSTNEKSSFIYLKHFTSLIQNDATNTSTHTREHKHWRRARCRNKWIGSSDNVRRESRKKNMIRTNHSTRSSCSTQSLNTNALWRCTSIHPIKNKRQNEWMPTQNSKRDERHWRKKKCVGNLFSNNCDSNRVCQNKREISTNVKLRTMWRQNVHAREMEKWDKEPQRELWMKNMRKWTKSASKIN